MALFSFFSARLLSQSEEDAGESNPSANETEKERERARESKREREKLEKRLAGMGGISCETFERRL